MSQDDLASLQRRRLLHQLELDAVDAAFRPVSLSVEQDAVIDSLCGLLPMADEPALLETVAPADRAAVVALVAQLPRTNAIQRLVDDHWPA